MGEKKIDKYVFQINDLLGEGSYGKVYRGYIEKTQDQVAIKMLNKSVINSDEYLREGLMSEIKVMQKLTGPHVVRLLDVLETSNNYYIIQEICDGGDFAEQLKQKKQLTEAEALKFFIDVLLGFMELVQNGIIHRDLKPANILIHKGSYKLADFGFAKTVDNFNRDMLSTSVGTPLYMSPQILASQKYTSKSDVWSMGFIFFESLYGRTPWTGRSIPDLISNIHKQKLSFPSSNQVNQDIQDLLTGCLQLEEAKRFSWDQIYRHKAFGDSFKFYMDLSKKLEDKVMYLINDLRMKIIQDKIDLEVLFQELDLTGDQQLDIIELGKLLQRIDKTLNKEEIAFIFNKLDSDNSNTIDFTEFTSWLQENQVRMSVKPGPGSYKHQPSLQPQKSYDNMNIQNKQPNPYGQSQPPSSQNYNQNNQAPQNNFGQNQQFQGGNQNNIQNPKQQTPEQDKADITIVKLKLAIKQFNINLWDLFKKYDKKENSQLDPNEFGIMLKRIDKTLTDHDIEAAFKKFDMDKNGLISYQEFKEVLDDQLTNQANSYGIAYQLTGQQPNQNGGQQQGVQQQGVQQQGGQQQGGQQQGVQQQGGQQGQWAQKSHGNQPTGYNQGGNQQQGGGSQQQVGGYQQQGGSYQQQIGNQQQGGNNQQGGGNFQQGGYQHQQGGYQQQGGFQLPSSNKQQQGGYQSPSSNQQQGGYQQQQQWGTQQQVGNYQNDNQQQGGYQSPSGNQHQGGQQQNNAYQSGGNGQNYNNQRQK